MIQHQRAWHSGVHTHFIPQWFCYYIPVLWAVVMVTQSTIHWHLLVDIYPSTKCTWSCWPFCQWRHPCLLHNAWNLHPSSVDALADIHGRSHSFPFIHPREVFLAWCWVIARPLSSCSVVLLSLPLGIGLTGVGLAHLSCAWQTSMHKGMPASDMMRRSNCDVGSVNVHAGFSLHMRQCLLWSDGLPHETCPPICPWASSSLEMASALTRTRLPGFKPTVHIFQS